MIMIVKRFIAAAVISGLNVSAFAGPEWVEQGDAGSLPPGAQIVGGGGGPLLKISGGLLGNGLNGLGDFEDMYLIQITDPAAFSATTTFVGGGDAQFDSQLWLLKMDGFGLLGNDDTFISGGPGFGSGTILSGSTLGPMATDGTRQTIPGAGLYLLAISGKFDIPNSLGGHIYSFASSIEISGPDGPGGAQSITDWQNVGLEDGSQFGSTGTYTIALTGTATVPAPSGLAAVAFAAIGCFGRRRRV